MMMEVCERVTCNSTNLHSSTGSNSLMAHNLTFPYMSIKRNDGMVLRNNRLMVFLFNSNPSKMTNRLKLVLIKMLHTKP